MDKWLAHLLEDHLGKLDQVHLAVQVRYHDGELIAAQSRHGVIATNTGFQALRYCLEEDVAKAVPHGVVDLLEAIQIDKHHSDQVFAANGSNEVLQTLLLTYAGPGRTVATFEPTYQMHGQIARVTGATVVEGERAADFSLDMAEVDRVLQQYSPSVTFLCSPNNPTGLVEPEAKIREVLAKAPGLLVVDEAYVDFGGESAVSLVREFPQLLVVRTFSKSRSLAGLRVGFACGQAHLIDALVPTLF